MATKRPPPTQAKLRTLLDSLKVIDTNDTRGWFTLSDQIAKIYKAGLPSGIDTAVIEECVEQKGPLTQDIMNMTKKAGTEYDGAIANGLRKLVTKLTPGLALDTNLVLALFDNDRAFSLRAAALQLQQTARLIERNVHNNVMINIDEESLSKITQSVAPWFSSGVLPSTLTIVESAVSPYLVTYDGGAQVTAPQTDEEWAMLVGCFMSKREETRQVLLQKKALFKQMPPENLEAVTNIARVSASMLGVSVLLLPKSANNW